VKGLLSLSTAALVLALGTSGAMLSTTDAQARTRINVYPKGSQQYYEFRAATVCKPTFASGGKYRTQNDTWLFSYGYCLSDVPAWY
jgi:hypothetical protein